MPRLASRARSSGRRECPVSTLWSRNASPMRATVHSMPPQSSSGPAAGMIEVIAISNAHAGSPSGGERGGGPHEVERGQPARRRHGLVDAPEGGERLPDDLVHVVVAIGRKPPAEPDVRRRKGQALVLLVELLVLGLRNRVVGVALGGRVLVGERGLGV